MAEIIGVITSVEDDSYDNKDFKKVTLDTGQVLKVKQGREGVLKAKWDLLQVNRVIKFIMKDYITPDKVKMPFVNDIETAELPPQPSSELEPVDEPPPKREATPPNPQAVGMMTKEIGDMIRSKYIMTIFGQEASSELIKWYRSQALGITRITFDGDKLPKFE